MDDLELVRRFRNDVPPPDDRARWAAMTAMFEAERPAVRPLRRQPSPRRWRYAAVVTAAAVTLALAVPILLPHGRGGAAPDAAAALRRAAAVAATQEGNPAPEAGQYVYTKTQSAYMDDWSDAGPNHEGFSVLMPRVREIWIGTDGSGRLVETTGTAQFLSDKDRAQWEASGRPDLGSNKTTDEAFPAAAPDQGGLYFMDLSSLPTDPDKLRAKIESREIEGGPPGDAETFTIIGDLLRETYASPALRSALYQVAAGLKGVELVGETKDPLGREGIAVAYTHAGARHELIFDPQTTALLGERYVVVSSGSGYRVPPGTVVGWAAYLSSGVVDSTSDRA